MTNGRSPRRYLFVTLPLPVVPNLRRVTTQAEPSAPDVELSFSEVDLSPPRPVSRVLELLFVLACCLVVLAALAPELIVTDSMPLGTDLVGHAVVAWFDSNNLLGFLPGSWSNDMFNGFPVNQLYPWLPSWIVGVLSLLMPLSIALKVGVALPLVLMPWAAWRAGTWARLPQPMAAMLAAGTLPYLFDTSCGSCGGTISSTINGEYAFAWAMLFAVLALGAIDRLAREGRGVAVSAVLVAATAFSHPLPTLWLVIGTGVLAIGREVWADRVVAARFGIAAGIAALLAALWWLPFLTYRGGWAPQNPLVREGDTLSWLLPATRTWELVFVALAIVGLVWAVRHRGWLLAAYAVGGVVALAGFLRFTDGGPFYSIRLLPFWSYGRWALAAVGFAWLVQVLVRRLSTDRTKPGDPRVAPVLWLVPAILLIGSTWGWWGVTEQPTRTSNGSAEVLGQKTEVTFVSAGVRTTFAGFAAREDYQQLVAVQDLVRGVADRYGCGTMMWDNGDVTQDSGPVFGDPQVFWQSSIWTDGCIPAADGVLVDSSMTAPAMGMTKSLVSQSVENLLPDRPTFTFDLTQGVQRMQTMGVRFYLTQGGAPAEQAATNDLLTLVAQSGAWQMWQVDKGVQAASLAALPAVFDPRLDDSDWESITNLYFTTSTYNQMPLAQDGPSSWPTATVDRLPKPSTIQAAGVSNIRLGEGIISFNVKNVGSPVVVRMSAFPGWTVTGAEGPYRASPNYLVVVPTSTTVTLTKGRTAIDWIAAGAGIAGLAILVGYVLYRRLEHRDDAAATDDASFEDMDDDGHGADGPAESDGATSPTSTGEGPSGDARPADRDPVDSVGSDTAPRAGSPGSHPV